MVPQPKQAKSCLKSPRGGGGGGSAACTTRAGSRTRGSGIGSGTLTILASTTTPLTTGLDVAMALDLGLNELQALEPFTRPAD